MEISSFGNPGHGREILPHSWLSVAQTRDLPFFATGIILEFIKEIHMVHYIQYASAMAK
jgi:hypothetical protein